MSAWEVTSYCLTEQVVISQGNLLQHKIFIDINVAQYGGFRSIFYEVVYVSCIFNTLSKRPLGKISERLVIFSR